MTNFTKGILSFSKKILSGSDLIKIKYSKDNWDTQYANGGWDFLLSSPQNNLDVVVGILNSVARERTENIRIMDIGCGNGSLARNLNPSIFDYTGIDISSEALQIAEKQFPTGNFIQSSMDQISPVSGVYDVILFCEVLLYGDYEKTLKNFSKNMSENTLIVVSLYDVWRTRIILHQIKKQLNIAQEVYVKNRTKKVGWTVITGKLKE